MKNNELMQKIKECAKLSDELSENENDRYARCTQYLLAAMGAIYPHLIQSENK